MISDKLMKHKYNVYAIIFWILIVLSLNGAISFVYTVFKGNYPETMWALLSVNFLFFSGMTQSGVIFSVMMRVVRTRWDCPFAKTGEMITLSTAPICLILFVILYTGGAGHIYSRVSEPPSIFWRNILTMGIFYALSYYYYYTCNFKENNITTTDNIEKRVNIPAFAVIVFYVIHNTIIAWDLGMRIIPHWESTIFPPYFWVGSIFAGMAFIFIVRGILMTGSGQLISNRNCDSNKNNAPQPEECNYRSRDLSHIEMNTGWIRCLDHMGKLLLGFTLLWTYMFWSQYIVIWYGDIPRFTGPLLRQMSGRYSGTFLLMLIITLILPFICLIQKRIRLSAIALLTVSLLICIGIWLNRYLMIIPVYSDKGTSIILTWTGISLTTAVTSITILSLVIFMRSRMQ